MSTVLPPLPGPVAVAVLLALAAAVVLERVHTYDEPLERDVAAYAVLGHEMRRGRHLYTDLWERKSPLLYDTFAAAERVCGYGPAEVFAVNVAAALATLFGCYAAGRAGGGEAWGGVAAAGLWTLLGADLKLQANQPNGEVFVNAALTAAFAVLALWPNADVRARWSRAVALGALFAAATLYKHNAAVACLTLAAAHVWVGRHRRRAAVAEAAVALGVTAAAWVALGVYFTAVGRLGAAFGVMVRENAGYAGSPVKAVADYFRPGALARGLGGWTAGPALLLAAWGVAGYRRVTTDRWVLCGAWAAGAVLATALPGHLFPHYYQYEIPLACVAGGWAAAALLGRGGRGPGVARGLAVAAAFAVAAGYEVPNYRLSADQWCRAKGTGDFAEQRRLGRWLAGTLGPGERFWDDGQDVTLYYEARQSPLSGLLFPDPLRTGTTAQTHAYRDRLTAEITAARPDVIVTCPATLANEGFRDPPLWRWVEQNYAVVPSAVPDCPDFAVRVRRGSDLERRLAAVRRPCGFTPQASHAA